MKGDTLAHLKNQQLETMISLKCYLPEITGNKGSMLTICYPNNISASDQGNDVKRYQKVIIKPKNVFIQGH